jgi:hypothetical protein
MRRFSARTANGEAALVQPAHPAADRLSKNFFHLSSSHRRALRAGEAVA